MAKKEAGGITIIKKEEIVEAGHHGGAWKVAYADFVTAMMAFFLLMWLLNATTEEQRRGIADYFSPANSQASTKSGSGMPLGGKSPFEDGQAMSDKGAVAVMNARAQPTDADDDDSDTPATRTIHEANAPQTDASGTESAKQTQPKPGKTPWQDGGRAETADAAAGIASGTASGTASGAAAEAARRQEQADFARAAEAIQKAVQSDPALAQIARQLSVELTPDGLRIQIRDSDNQPMFETGSAEPNARASDALRKLTPILLGLHEPIAIAGYTDAQPYAGNGRTNWDLSADRANATRRILTDNGLPDARIRDVTGHGDRDLLVAAEPNAASNRRIAILLVRTAPALPVGATPDGAGVAAAARNAAAAPPSPQP